MDNPHVKHRGDVYDPEKANQRIEEASGKQYSEIKNQYESVYERFKQNLIDTLNRLRSENALLREENARLRNEIGNVQRMRDAG